MVNQHPIDLFGHPLIKGPQPGLDMGALDVQLCRRQSAGQGGVGVPEYYDRIRLLLLQDLFYLFEHLASLKSMAARAYAQVIVRRCYAHLIEEYSVHLIVVVLAGMDYDLIDISFSYLL